MNDDKMKMPQALTEEDLENLSGAFETMGPNYGGTPWSRIVSDADDNIRTQWENNIKTQFVAEIDESELKGLNINEEDLENLSGMVNATGPNYGGSPWSRIVNAAPDDFKDKWRRKLADKYSKM